MRMATQTLVAPETYLRMSFEGPDREYVDGELVERGVPTYLHARIQMILGSLFETLRRQHPVFAASELRLALHSNHRYRIPDVCVFAGQEPTEAIPDTPPLIAIEIVSPDDRTSESLKKFEEYRHWGVTHIWLIDPLEKTFFSYDATGLHPVDTLDLPEYSFSIRLADLNL